MTTEQPILLVEDSEDDVFFMRRAMDKAAIENPIYVVEDGQKAIEYFSGAGEFSDRSAFPLPALVFLDLKLPGTMGLDVLAWIRQQPALRRTIVIILTSSQEPSDLRRAYDLGVNSYLLKPSSTERLEELVRAAKSYWLGFNLFDPAS